MKIENSLKGLCVICDRPITVWQLLICKACNLPCGGKDTILSPESKDGFTIIDTVSDCCNADVELISQTTCSMVCHDKFIIEMQEQFGVEKIIQDMETGKKHKVPVKDIVEKGLKHEDLIKYPQIDEAVI
jgi:hypothetical protein